MGHQITRPRWNRHVALRALFSVMVLLCGNWGWGAPPADDDDDDMDIAVTVADTAAPHVHVHVQALELQPHHTAAADFDRPAVTTRGDRIAGRGRRIIGAAGGGEVPK